MEIVHTLEDQWIWVAIFFSSSCLDDSFRCCRNQCFQWNDSNNNNNYNLIVLFPYFNGTINPKKKPVCRLLSFLLHPFKSIQVYLEASRWWKSELKQRKYNRLLAEKKKHTQNVKFSVLSVKTVQIRVWKRQRENATELREAAIERKKNKQTTIYDSIHGNEQEWNQLDNVCMRYIWAWLSCIHQNHMWKLLRSSQRSQDENRIRCDYVRKQNKQKRIRFAPALYILIAEHRLHVHDD